MTKTLNYLKSPVARPFIVLVVVLAVGAGALLIAHGGTKQYSGARAVADGFAQATADCDVDKAKLYYQPFSNSAYVAYFKQHCVKDFEVLNYDHQLDANTKTEKGVQTKTVYFDYRLSQKGKDTSHVVLIVQWTSKTNKWQVINVSQETQGPAASPAKK